MAENNSKCRITVLKRTINSDLVKDYLDEKYANMDPCERFEDGQELTVSDYYGVPKDFCPSAWADIRKDVMTVAFGGNIPGIRQQGTIITACRDWFRPVYFKVERLEND